MIIALLCLTCLANLPGRGSLPAAQEADSWTRWRGPLGTGEAPDADPPVTWSETENLKWKTALPGKGHSTPVVWDRTIVVLAAEPFGEKSPPRFSGRPGAHDNLAVSQRHRFLVIAVNRDDGSIRWQKTVHEALPHEGAHYTASLASASPVTDGQRIYADFGSYGLYCLDFAGNVVWEKSADPLHTKHGHGEGSSPALHGDTLIINRDHEEDSFIAAFDKSDGRELWRVPRPEVTSWSSPVIAEQEGQVQVIVAGTGRIRGYDIRDGRVIWECGGLSNNVVATPVVGDGMVFAGSSYDTRAMFGIRLAGAAGDITGTDHVAWFTRNRTPYVPSPLLYGDSIYFLRHYQNVLTRLDAKTGNEPAGPFRLTGLRNIYASPVAAKNRIYITDREGLTIVFSHAEDLAREVPRVLAANKLDDSVSASLALAGRQIFLRGEKFLYCIEEE